MLAGEITTLYQRQTWTINEIKGSTKEVLP